MKQFVLVALMVCFAATLPAQACLGLMHANETQVPVVDLPVAKNSKAKALRDGREKLHQQVEQTESVKALTLAKKLLDV
jgi:hypothetical protein